MPTSSNRKSTQRGSSNNRNPSTSRNSSSRPQGSRMSDEEYARRLQREYVQESQRTGGRQSSSAHEPKGVYPVPLRTSSTADSSLGPSIPARNPDHRSPTHSPQRSPRTRDGNSLDEEYARRVEQQIRDEELARRVMQEERDAHAARQLSNPALARGVVVAGTSRSQQNGRAARSSGHGTGHARSTNRQPQRVQQTQAVQSHQHGKSGNCCCKALNRFVSLALCVGVLIVCGAVIYVIYTGKDVGIPGTDVSVGDITDVFMHDPWEHGTGANQTQTFWRSGGNSGLSLKVYNSLDSAWHPFYVQALSDWENGTPDALTLSTETIAPNPSCEAINGAMRVCNGDYGNTGWKGINEVLISGTGQISVSVAKMNEYYLKPGADAEWQYTMCHEMGHGFGLNHADENFNNRDLGTCMDYTNRPQNNLTPNTDSYQILAGLYGIVGGGASAQSRSSSIEALKVQEQTGQTRASNLDIYGNRLFRGLRGSEPVPAFESFANDRSQFRLLSRRKNLELHERDLGNGYRIVAHLLLAEDAEDVIEEDELAPMLEMNPELLAMIEGEEEATR